MKYYERREGVVAWQPSTWPEAPTEWNAALGEELRGIINETIVNELSNVIGDAIAQRGDLRHRGHVVALGLLCAIDALSAYGYGDEPHDPTCVNCGRSGERIGPRYKAFVRAHFPRGYAGFANALWGAYRNSTVHSWHLFRVAILPGNEPISEENNSVVFGLLDFFEALKEAIDDFFNKLTAETRLQENVLRRYAELRTTAQ